MRRFAKIVMPGLLLLLLLSPPVMSDESTLVYCSQNSPRTFNPQLVSDTATFDATARIIYETLTHFERGTTRIVPGLAEKWDISEDGKTYTFHLRKNVKFHTIPSFTPSRNLNADDVLFTFDRMINKGNPYHNVSNGTYQYFESMNMDSLINEIEKVDDHTIKFVLNTPNAPFLSNMAMGFASILSKEYADRMLSQKSPEKLDLVPVGTGPFMLVSYQQDAIIRYRKNPYYWSTDNNRRPLVDNAIFVITPDAADRYAKLKKGECQIMALPTPSDISEMKGNPDLVVLNKPGLNVGYMPFNTKKTPLNNLNVRKALTMAVDLDAIIKTIYMDQAKIATNPMPPTIWGFNNAIKRYPHDPETAEKLLKKGLKEAGHEGTLTIDLWAMPGQHSYNPDARKMAAMIQADWKKIGVNSKIISYEWHEYLRRERNGDHMVAMNGWVSDNGDPDNFLGYLLSCAAVGAGNYANWCFKPYDDLIRQAVQISDQSKREVLYEKAQQIFHEQVPWIPIAYADVFQPLRKNIKGFKVNPFGGIELYGVCLEGSCPEGYPE